MTIKVKDTPSDYAICYCCNMSINITITFEDIHGCSNSIRLCDDCERQLYDSLRTRKLTKILNKDNRQQN